MCSLYVPLVWLCQCVLHFCVHLIFTCWICLRVICYLGADIETPCACGPSAIEDLVVELESSGEEGTDVQFPRYAVVEPYHTRVISKHTPPDEFLGWFSRQQRRRKRRAMSPSMEVYRRARSLCVPLHYFRRNSARKLVPGGMLSYHPCHTNSIPHRLRLSVAGQSFIARRILPVEEGSGIDSGSIARTLTR